MDRVVEGRVGQGKPRREERAPAREQVGGKRIRGRKRRILVDVEGFLLTDISVVRHEDCNPRGNYVMAGDQPQPVKWGFRVLPGRWIVERTSAHIG